MSNNNVQHIRRQERRFTGAGEVPTVPTVANHKTPGWLDTDIYLGEIVVNTTDDKVYTRTVNGIVEITSGVGGGGGGIWSQNGTSAYYNTGNVGIDTSAPGFKLQVEGNMQAANGDYILSLDDDLMGTGVIHAGASNYDGTNMYINGITDLTSIGDLTGLKAVMLHSDLGNGSFTQIAVSLEAIDLSANSPSGANIMQQYIPSGVRTAVTDSAGASAFMNITDTYIALSRNNNGEQEFTLNDDSTKMGYVNVDSSINSSIFIDSSMGDIVIDFENDQYQVAHIINSGGQIFTYNDVASSIDHTLSFTQAGLYIDLNDTVGELSARFDTEHGFVMYSANPTPSSILFTLRDALDVIVSSINNSGKLFCKKVSIGAEMFIPSAIVEIDSTTQGFLPPRMTTSNRDNIVAPVEGLVVYNTTTSTLQFYNGNVWGNV